MSSSAFSLPGPSGSTSSTPSKQLRALVSQAQDGDASHLAALAASLQRTQLLRSLATWTPADEEDELATSSTLSRLSKLTSSHLAQPPYAGAKLATLQLQAEPASSDAQPWASAVLAALLQLAERGAKAVQRRQAAAGQPLVDLLQLADQLLGAPSRADERAEYKRAVVTPGLPRYATALVGILECMADEGSADECLPVLSALTLHLTSHPASYRPHTPRLNKTLHALLYTHPLRSAAGQAASVKLAAALHRTGASARGKSASSSSAAGGGTTDALWAATIAAPLTAARAAWSVVSSAFAAQGAAHEMDAAFPPALLPSDPLEALEPALERLELLLGDEERTGVLPLLLAQGTVSHVPVPLEALLELALRIIALGPAPAARSPPPDSTLLARQTAALPRSQAAALRLLCAVLLAVPRASLAQRAPLIVSTLLEQIEHARTSAPLRATLFNALALCLSARSLVSGSAAPLLGAGLPLDPASGLVTRTARVCITHLAEWVAHPAPAPAEAPSTSGMRKKRARYESDAIGLGQSAVASGLVALPADEEASANAALEVLASIEGLLATELTPAHAALRRTYALLLLSLGTLALACPGSTNEALAARVLDALALLVRTAEGALLTLLLARTTHLSALSLASPSRAVRERGSALRLAAHEVMDPRLPPRLGRAAEERPAEWGVEEGEALGALHISADGAGSALLELGIFSKGAAPALESTPSVSHAAAAAGSYPSPSASAHSPRHLPHAHAGPRNSDPVKPAHRPHTPRIGSPASPDRSLGLGMSNGAGSPARAVFGAPLSVASSQSSTDTSASAFGKEGKTALAAPARELPVVVIPEARRAAPQQQQQREESDGEDEEMPSIDLGDSDEEDDGEDERMEG